MLRILALSLVLVLVACGQASQSEPATEQQTSTPAQDAQPEAAQPEAAVANYAVGDKVQLTGTAGCGHCSYHATQGCAMAMKVGEVVYVLDGIAEDTEAFNQRTSGKQITVTGTLTDAGDPRHIQVETHAML